MTDEDSPGLPAPRRLAVVGATGRMGRAVIRLAPSLGFTLVRAVSGDHAGEDVGIAIGGTGLGVRIEPDPSGLASGGFDVIVDFSGPAATAKLLEVATHATGALVTGTTGLGADIERALDTASTRSAVLWEPNMSMGVHVLVGLVRRAALQLGPDFDAEVTEVHHRLKVDAPSGTAKRLIDTLRSTRGEAQVIFGREGRPGPRSPREIGVHALRGGDVVGDHTVYFLGPGERVELSHRATDRDVFARGALRAAAFLIGKPPGRYTMGDVLGTGSERGG